MMTRARFLTCLSFMFILIVVTLRPTKSWSIWLTDPFESALKESVHKETANRQKSSDYHEVSETMTFSLQSSQSWREKPRLEVFCHESEAKSILLFWSSIDMKITERSPSSPTGSLEPITVFYGTNESSVRQAHQEYSNRIVKLPFWGSSSESFSFNVFSNECIGIAFKGNMVIKVTRSIISILKCSLTIFGVILFFVSPKLAKNPLLFYGSSVSTGILASLVILVYVLHKFLPKNIASFAVFMGSSATLLIYKMLYSHFYTLIQDYSTVLLIYVVLSAMVSFGISYYFGPPTSKRAHSLIQWFIQGVSLVMILCSSHHSQGVCFLALTVLVVYNMPFKILCIYISWMRSFWSNSNSRINQPLLLSEEEYTRQGDLETERALKELREYCRSPKSDAWKIVNSVSDPSKFAKFVAGDAHVSDEEVSLYEDSFKSSSFTELEFDVTNEVLTDDEDLQGLAFDETDEEDSITPTARFPDSIRRLSPILREKQSNSRLRNYSGNSRSSTTTNSSRKSRR